MNVWKHAQSPLWRAETRQLIICWPLRKFYVLTNSPFASLLRLFLPLTCDYRKQALEVSSPGRHILQTTNERYQVYCFCTFLCFLRMQLRIISYVKFERQSAAPSPPLRLNIIRQPLLVTVDSFWKTFRTSGKVIKRPQHQACWSGPQPEGGQPGNCPHPAFFKNMFGCYEQQQVTQVRTILPTQPPKMVQQQVTIVLPSPRK